jgi:uncharacterized protein YjaG (DUF416 family)
MQFWGVLVLVLAAAFGTTHWQLLSTDACKCVASVSCSKLKYMTLEHTIPYSYTSSTTLAVLVSDRTATVLCSAWHNYHATLQTLQYTADGIFRC